MYTKEQRLEAYRKLPESVREVISSDRTMETIKGIGDKHGILIDKLGELSDEIGLVLFGLEPAKNFKANIRSKLGLPDDKAGLITSEVDEKIFKPIRGSLMEEKSTEMVAEEEEPDEVISRQDLLREIEAPQKAVVRTEKIEPVGLELSSGNPQSQLADKKKVETSPPPGQNLATMETKSQQEPPFLKAPIVGPTTAVPPHQEPQIPSKPEERLEGIVRMPKEEISISIPKTPQNSKPKMDPYRMEVDPNDLRFGER